MNKKFTHSVVVVTAVLCAVFAIPAMAETNATSTIRGEFKERIKGLRENITTQIKIERDTIQAKRMELETQLKDEREAAKKRIEAVREEAKKNIETRQTELKDNISKLRDEKKKQIATRLNEQLAHINVQWTDNFNNTLNRLSEIISKMELRADKAQSAGKDVSAVRTVIQNAKTAVATARTAVETQAKKIYLPCIYGVSTFGNCTFASEKDLGSAFKAARERLKKDLSDLRDGSMKSAREAVQNALQALKGVPRVDDESKATTTPSQ